MKKLENPEHNKPMGDEKVFQDLVQDLGSKIQRRVSYDETDEQCAMLQNLVTEITKREFYNK